MVYPLDCFVTLQKAMTTLNMCTLTVLKCRDIYSALEEKAPRDLNMHEHSLSVMQMVTTEQSKK